MELSWDAFGLHFVGAWLSDVVQYSEPFLVAGLASQGVLVQAQYLSSALSALPGLAHSDFFFFSLKITS
jgi:hypothetical protein